MNDRVDQFLRSLDGPSASADQLRESQERLRGLVAREWEERAEERASNSAAVSPAKRNRVKPALWIAIPAFAALLLFLVFPRHVDSPKTTASAGVGDVQKLPDGSQIENGPGAEYEVQWRSDGTRIELSRGAIIVTAAKQHDGPLVVSTKDFDIAVVGTVFSVRVEPEGSRVSVFEGKVKVTNGTQARSLLPGEHLATIASMSLVSMQKEIEWSRNAAALVAMVPPPAAPPTPAAVAASPVRQVTGSGPSSIEGRVFARGTNEPLDNVDLELSRVEGTTASPLAPGVAEMFESILNFNSRGWPDAGNGATAPALIAPELKYTRTGSDGRFKFDSLKDGKYRLAAVRTGQYYPAEYGQRDIQQRGLFFPVGVGEAVKDLRIEMIPTSAITGRVVDEDGQPLGHLIVLALTAQYRNGERRFFIERQAVTDENGNYRLYWLGPGRYYVAAVYEDPKRRSTEMAPTAPPGRTVARYRATSPTIVRQVLADGSVTEDAYGVVYFGGTTDPVAAVPVDVTPGQTYGGADIAMGAGKMRTHHIKGVVVNGETGQPVRGAQVLAIPRQWRPNALVLLGNTDANGAFDLAGAFPDGYLLTAAVGAFAPANLPPGVFPNSTNPVPAGARPQIGYLSVDTDDRQPSSVRIVTTPGISVAGRISIERNSQDDAAAAAALAKMRIELTRDPDLIAMPEVFMQPPPPPAGTQAVRNGQVSGTGDFSMLIAPGDFRVNVANVPPETYVKSMRMGGQDLLRSGLRITSSTDTPVQIVIGTDGGTITGSVVDGASRPFTNAVVALVPDAADLRGRTEFYRNTTSDAAGSFTLKTVPPGAYKLFAWEWVPPGAWENADFIRGHEGAGRSIQIGPSERQQQIRLTVIPKPR